MELPPPLAELARDPARAAILLDIDGTLAPIVADPTQSRVPDETRAELVRLTGRYALVGCLTGRPQEQARAIVGVEALEYIGEHGLELRPEAGDWGDLLDRFVREAPLPAERKRFTVAFHYRTAPDEGAAVDALTAVATRAAEEGLVPKWGRKVLELRPPIDAHKGTAVVHLLTSRGIHRALFAGDDLTDLDGFRAMDDLELGVKIAVVSPESPSGLAAEADVVVEGPPQLLDLLRQL
ncbi:MAG: trehalose-phosphatase [Thermoleophilia bacterium]|nr:trehalose-phosphatase [Thermoleophilia bacterium]